MANDERQSEQFIREVDEELRRAQLKALWDRFAPLIIGVCILIVAITAGYRGWIWWQERKAAQAGDRFMAALTEVESGDRAKGEAELSAIAADSGSGYAALARLRLAGGKAAAGDKAAALAAYDAVTNDNSLPLPLRDVGRIRAALLALDTGDLKGARERAEPLNVPGNSWRHAAREVIGTAAYQAGDLQAARDAFTQIQRDLREQYLVAYSPRNKTRDGAYRKIEIQIINPELKQQNLKLNYRAGYFAKTAVPETPAKRKSSGQ